MKQVLKSRTNYVFWTTNIKNGTVYVAQTTKINHENYLGSGRYFLKALKLYGRENFKKEILQYHDNQEDLNNAEIYFIGLCRELGFKMYNLMSGGKQGGRHSDETKAKMSQSTMGVGLGKTLSDEHKAKISKAQMGSARNLGKILTDETKAKMSKAHMGKTYTSGKTLSDEHKAKISVYQANRKHDPFYYNGEYFPNKTVCIKKYFPELSRCKFTTYMKKNPDLFS